jgi:hypothetical protein
MPCFLLGKRFKFNSGGLDLTTIALWKTALFYAGSAKIARKTGHFYSLFIDSRPKMAQTSAAEGLLLFGQKLANSSAITGGSLPEKW